MIVTTADVIPGQAVQVLGLVRGNIVTSKNIGRDLMAGMKSIVGGEIVSYTQMTDEARQVAEDLDVHRRAKPWGRRRCRHAFRERQHCRGHD